MELKLFGGYLQHNNHQTTLLSIILFSSYESKNNNKNNKNNMNQLLFIAISDIPGGILYMNGTYDQY